MNKLDLVMSQANMHDRYSQINQYHARLGNGRSKLRTCILFKLEFITEPHVTMIMCVGLCVRLQKLGSKPVDRNVMLYLFLEDEFHVLMKCTLYGDLRYELFPNASVLNSVLMF